MAKKSKKTDEPEETTPEAAQEAVAVASLPPTPKPKLDVTDFTGDALKNVREGLGLSLREISDRTKITVPILSALEEERYDKMPNARVYVRGFVRCLARELSLDMDQVSKSYLPRWERWANQHAADRG